MLKIVYPAALAAALVAVATAAPAHAVTVDRNDVVNAAGSCQGALPAFAGSLRARPLVLRNEGAGTAFVSCSLEGGESAYSRATIRVTIRLFNGGAQGTDLSCTLVNGFENYGPPVTYHAKTAYAAAGAYVILSFVEGVDGVSAAINGANLSCALPSGAGVSFVGIEYSEYVGQ